MKIVFNDFESEYSDLLTRFGTKSVFQLRINRRLTEVYKTLNGLNPAYLNSIFEIRDIPYEFRDNSKLTQTKKVTTTFGLRSVNYVGSKLWNKLPPHIKGSPDLVRSRSEEYEFQTWARL